MFRRISVFFAAAIASSCFCACNRADVVESVPVEDIEVSAQPSQEEASEAPAALTDDYGVRLPDEWRVYGAVVPVGYKDVARSGADTRFYVGGMSERDVERFLDKYFPYQPRSYSGPYRMHEVMPWLKDIYKEGAIVPDLNPNVYRPEPPIYLRITYDKSRQEFLWVYSDPTLYDREQALYGKKGCASCGKNDDSGRNDDGGEPAAPAHEMTADQLAKICATCRDMNSGDEKMRAEACRTCDEESSKFDKAVIDKYELKSKIGESDKK